MLMIVDCKNMISRGAKSSHVARDADSLSFGALADELLGPRGKFWADITVVFTQLAFGTAYIIYAGSNCSLVAQTYGHASPTVSITASFLFLSDCCRYSFSLAGLNSDVLLMMAAGAAVSPFVLLRFCQLLHQLLDQFVKPLLLLQLFHRFTPHARSMRALAPVCTFALIALCYGVVCIAYYSIEKIVESPPDNLPLSNWKTFPST